ncbi:MAG: hypothetical protein Q7S74_02690 [Nanoarchaeota archaeon]|nr:hypothetical protein [Nanoarchaeota archaeon]
MTIQHTFENHSEICYGSDQETKYYTEALDNIARIITKFTNGIDEFLKASGGYIIKERYCPASEKLYYSSGTLVYVLHNSSFIPCKGDTGVNAGNIKYDCRIDLLSESSENNSKLSRMLTELFGNEGIEKDIGNKEKINLWAERKN